MSKNRRGGKKKAGRRPRQTPAVEMPPAAAILPLQSEQIKGLARSLIGKVARHGADEIIKKALQY